MANISFMGETEIVGCDEELLGAKWYQRLGTAAVKVATSPVRIPIDIARGKIRPGAAITAVAAPGIAPAMPIASGAVTAWGAKKIITRRTQPGRAPLPWLKTRATGIRRALPDYAALQKAKTDMIINRAVRALTAARDRARAATKAAKTYQAVNLAMRDVANAMNKDYGLAENSAQVKSLKGQLKFILNNMKARRNVLVKQQELPKKVQPKVTPDQEPAPVGDRQEGSYGLTWSIGAIQKAISADKVTGEQVSAAVEGSMSESDAKKIYRKVHGGGVGWLLPVAVVGVGAFMAFRG